MADFLVRSQIDCYHPSLPKQFFDIKTRANSRIRWNQANIKDNTHYKITKKLGFHDSFEREMYDMVRGPFLKYGFQARLGGMDGIFICYHNTVQTFGFQYITVEDMDEWVYGNSAFAKDMFTILVKLFTAILTRVKLDMGKMVLLLIVL